MVDGSFAYVADTDKWRIDSYLDPTKYPGMNTTLLYDGAQFAYQAHEMSVLSVQSGPAPASLGMMLLNPAFESIQFLFPLDQTNEGAQAQLADVKAVTANTTLGSVTWTPVLVNGKTLDRAEFPGSTYNGIVYTHHVYAKSNAHDRPLIIDRVDAAGGVITRTQLSHYDDVISPTGSNSAWPRNVTWQVFDPNDGGLVGEISMVIDGVSINQPTQIAQGVFDVASLPPASVTVVNGVAQP